MKKMKDYINGCYTKYGTSPLEDKEIKGDFKLPNNMYCVVGKHHKDGISADIYKNNSKEELIFMEHGYITNTDISTKSGIDIIKHMVILRCQEMKLF